MRRTLLITGSFVWVGVTWMKFSVVSYGFLSLVLTIVGLPASNLPLNLNAAEFWIASLAWIGGGVYLFSQLKQSLWGKKETSRRSINIAATTLALSAYCALICPIIAPLPPDVQGQLVTTRLQAPLTPAHLHVDIEEANMTETTGMDALLTRVNSHLFGRRIHISGERSDTRQNTSSFIFVLGTDDAGRDVLSRLIYGARTSLGIGLLSMLGALALGIIIGVSAGYFGGTTDSLLMRSTDLFLAIPSIFLAIGMVAFLGNSITTLVLVLALSGWMSIARVLRNDIASLRQREFMVAATMLGIPKPSILMRHVIPNIRPLLVTAAVLQFANAVLGEAALSFLGLGVQPPTPTWGNMMGDATMYLQKAWWMGVFPGLALAVVLVAAHRATGALISPEKANTQHI
ncbi:MAG: ABC transporter permease [Bacteroidota bacterium]